MEAKTMLPLHSNTNYSRVPGRTPFILLLLGAVILSLIFPLYLSLFGGVSASHAPKPIPAKPSGTLRVMTYNIRHGEGLDNRVDLERTIGELQKANPDVVALQEVDRYWWRSGMEDQVKKIAASLHMYYEYSPSIQKGFAQYGNALLSRYPLTAPHIYALPGEKEPRSVITVQLDTAHGPVTIAATHLGVSAEDRKRQLPLVTDIVAALPGPKIVMGDFNAGAAGPGMAALLSAVAPIPLIDPMGTVQHGGEIDHILTNLPLSGDAWTQASDASDHIPVISDLRL
ncbi:endonuclease/exonuclease/phosphatase family protein [Paenibacillus thalictri]|nr:endonuclease/exonuclease/phosphatase family protein [Paenibacillus thalictri]